MAVYIDQKHRAKYAGLWDKTKKYNPYSIVTTDQGYFLSASPVPAGIDISNDSYWIWYAGAGDPSALEARVTALEELTGDMGSTIAIQGELLDAISDNVIEQGNQIIELSSALSITGEALQSLDTRLTASEGHINNLASALTVTGQRITDLESRVAANENNIRLLSSTFDVVGNDVDHINTDAINFVKMITGIN